MLDGMDDATRAWAREMLRVELEREARRKRRNRALLWVAVVLLIGGPVVGVTTYYYVDQARQDRISEQRVNDMYDDMRGAG